MQPFSIFSRIFGSRSSRKPIRNHSRLSLESLEDRCLMSVSQDFVNLKAKIFSYLDTVDDAINTIVKIEDAKLPIVNKSLHDMLGDTANIMEFKTAFHNAVEQIHEDADLAGLGGLLDNALGDFKTAPSQVTVAQNGNDRLLDVKLHLGFNIAHVSTTFGLGLDGLPFHAKGEFAFDVGLNIPTLEFGLDKDAHPVIDPVTIELKASAGLVNPDIQADVGFLHFQVAPNPAKPADAPAASLNASFSISIGLDAQLNPIVSEPKLTANADVDCILMGGFADDVDLQAPSVSTNLLVHWNFANSQAKKTDETFGDNLSVVFKDVSVDLGSYLTHMIGPTIKDIQKFTDPMKDFFHTLGEPIPVISDVAKVFGDNDGVSILELAGAVADTGQVPAQYETIIRIAKIVIEITNVIDAIKLSPNFNHAFIPIGTFDVIGNQGNQIADDVRNVAKNLDFGKVSSLNWSNLKDFAGTIAENLKQGITDAIDDPALSGALNDLIDKLQQATDFTGGNSASLKIAFPVIDHPAAAVFGLLIGRDTDLVSFTADAQLNSSAKMPIFSFEGFTVTLGGGIMVDAHLKLAYDTYGLRQIVNDFIQDPDAALAKVPENLLDGIYIDPTSHLKIGGTVTLSGGLDYLLLQAHVTGSLTANFNAEINDKYTDANGEHDIDADHDNKIRFNEFNEHLLHVFGDIKGSLDLDFKEGIDPLSLEQHINLGQTTFASFGDTTLNPFEPPPAVQLYSFNAATGVLTLNMGDNAHRTARNIMKNEINENFIIIHSNYRDGEVATPGTEAVYVSAFGQVQRQTGVKKIIAHADNGNDSITINDNVTAAVELYGDSGDDTITTGGGVAIVYGGTGNDIFHAGPGGATIHGGGDNDQIYGGIGTNHLYGDDGNDTIVDGGGVNVMFGGNGDDYLLGADGHNTMDGGANNDHLVAGRLNDTLNGGDGNDSLEAGHGAGILNGGNGNDQFVWHLSNPDDNPKILESDGAVKINGGGGRDQITVFGGPNADVFTIGKTVNNNKYHFEIQAPFDGEAGIGSLGYTPILLEAMEEFNIEGGKGADFITVNDMSGKRSLTIGVNLGDVTKFQNGQGDGVADKVIINATQHADKITVQNKQVAVHIPSNTEGPPVLGGITAFSGFLLYNVLVANVEDDVTFNALGGSDKINVLGITGPTLIHGDGNAHASPDDDDLFNVSAKTADDYAADLVIEADGGVNTINFAETGSIADTYSLQQNHLESQLLNKVDFNATGGNFNGGVSLSTGAGNDTVNLRSTLPNTHTTILTNGGDDAVTVSSLAPDTSANLNVILGILSIDVGAGLNNTLTLADSGVVAGNQNVFISSNKIGGLAGPLDNTVIDYHSTNNGELALNILGSNNANLMEHFIVNNPDAKLNLQGQGGNDAIDVSALSKTTVLNGGEGNDTITLGYGFNKINAITAPVFVLADTGNDRLNIIDTQSNASNTYALGTNFVIRSGLGQITYDKVEMVNLTTGTSADDVLVLGNSVALSFVLNTNAGNDRLTSPNSDTTWNLTALNAGKLGNVQFSNVENLRGGTASDRFVFTDGNPGVTGNIDGGTGGDTIDYSQNSTAIKINLQNKTIAANGGIVHFNGIEEFVGGNGSDEITGPNAANAWQIDGANQGQVNSFAPGIYHFTSIENLKGGTSTDSFLFHPAGQLSGALGGGNGVDTLDYSEFAANMPVRVNLPAEKATRVVGRVTGIENVIGGAGDDLFVGTAGANKFVGGAGRDVLIGGAGIDILQGGSGEDILIGGTTQYDLNATALEAIMSEWTTRLAFAGRRDRLLGTTPGAAFKLTTQTVLQDNSTDKMTGGAGDADWFWGLANEITDLNVADGDKIGAN